VVSTDDHGEPLRRIVEEVLLHFGATSAHDALNEAAKRARQANIQVNGSQILEYWWHLARLGFIALPGDTLQSGFFNSRLFLTDRGRDLLLRNESSPHDRHRYIEALRRTADPVDEVALVYVEESAVAWECGAYRASVVMLGCACERLVLLLVDGVEKAGVDPWSEKIQRLREKGRPLQISAVFDLVRQGLKDLAGKERIPGKLTDALDRRISSIFDHARILRNASGHPTADEVSAEEAEAGLLLFPGFHSLVSELVTALARESAPVEKP
jgi:hypothetical protein